MLSKNISLIIRKISNSTFNQDLINQICFSAMEIQISKLKSKKDHNILVADMINSLSNMSSEHENLVFTNPFTVINLSWIAKYIKTRGINNEKSNLLAKNIVDIAKSNLVLQNEFPIEMKIQLIDNLKLQDSVNSDMLESWVNHVKYDTRNFRNRVFFAHIGDIENFIIYNNQYIADMPESQVNQIGIYLILKKSFFPLILLVLLRPTDLLLKNISNITVTNPSISELFGLDILLSNFSN